MSEEHDGVNSDPDAELADPDDDTIGAEWDEMAGWPLDDEDEDEE